MKPIRNSRAARILSWVLTVATMAASLATLSASRSAMGQTGGQAPSGNLLTVIVIDFANLDKNHTGGDALARFATDAVAVEMASSARFEVIRREEVTRTANELGYRPPYDRFQLSRIATQLGAQAVVTGEIVFVRPEGGKGQGVRGVTVGMRVRITDATSGEDINGTAQVSTADAKPGQNDVDSLAQEAVTKAALRGVREILQFTLPEGIVTNTAGGSGAGGTQQILINRGARDGIKAGMEMLVLRDRQRVGRIRITAVFPTDSEAQVVENNLGIRPEDHVRAVFSVPQINERGQTQDARPRRSTSSAAGTLGKVLLVILAGVIIAQAANSHGGSVTGVTAEADVVNQSPAVRLTWRDNLFGGGTLEYHIFRTPGVYFNFAATPVAAIGGAQNQYEDIAGQSFWNGTNGFLQVPNPSNANNGGNGGNGGNGTATVVTPVAGAVTGPAPGNTYVYQVTAVIRRQSVTSGNNQNNQNGGNSGVSVEDIESNPTNSGPATPINPPLNNSAFNRFEPAQQVNLASVTGLSFTSVQGADQFVVEISSDRTFTDRSRIVQLGPFYSTAPNATGVVQTVPGFNLLTGGLNNPLRKDPTFNNFVNRVPGASTPTLFYRIGARNSGDRPGPVNALTRNPKDEDRTFRFIYSTVRTFQPAALPPNPP